MEQKKVNNIEISSSREIKSKNDIIDYFASGIKQDELIGVENEQFLFNIKTNKRCTNEGQIEIKWNISKL